MLAVAVFGQNIYKAQLAQDYSDYEGYYDDYYYEEPAMPEEPAEPEAPAEDDGETEQEEDGQEEDGQEEQQDGDADSDDETDETTDESSDDNTETDESSDDETESDKGAAEDSKTDQEGEAKPSDSQTDDGKTGVDTGTGSSTGTGSTKRKHCLEVCAETSVIECTVENLIDWICVNTIFAKCGKECGPSPDVGGLCAGVECLGIGQVFCGMKENIPVFGASIPKEFKGVCACVPVCPKKPQEDQQGEGANKDSGTGATKDDNCPEPPVCPDVAEGCHYDYFKDDDGCILGCGFKVCDGQSEGNGSSESSGIGSAKKPRRGPQDPENICGDGRLFEPEQCEENSDCESGYTCTECTCVKCGNKILEKGEECEFNGHCEEGEWCSECGCKSRKDTICGNALLEEGEQCDAGYPCPIISQTCTPNCMCETGDAVCDNGAIESPEQCETSDDCSSDQSCVDCMCIALECTEGNNWSCQQHEQCEDNEQCSDCICRKLPECGNETLDLGEECEEDVRECEEEGKKCDPKRCICVSDEPKCGDFSLDDGEECELNYTFCGARGTCNMETCLCEAECGNGVIEVGEACDGKGTCSDDDKECTDKCACK
ncbi:MAG: hypothetical protein QF809_00885 [Candidatus Peribacteraceae bacterium]|jgi:hypothetical protein|nr:hypothetical protein [Candidatus Peribacteraceae bacterium]